MFIWFFSPRNPERVFKRMFLLRGFDVIEENIDELYPYSLKLWVHVIENFSFNHSLTQFEINACMNKWLQMKDQRFYAGGRVIDSILFTPHSKKDDLKSASNETICQIVCRWCSDVTHVWTRFTKTTTVDSTHELPTLLDWLNIKG